MKDGEQLTVS